MTRTPDTDSIPAPMSDTLARTLSTIVAAHGGTLTIRQADILDAPAYIDLHITDDHLTLTATPDEQRTSAATIWFDGFTAVRLLNWTATVFGSDFVITGTLVPSPMWPMVGDQVPILRIDLPGRGAFAEVKARVTITNVGADVTLTIGIDCTHLETP